MMMWKKETSERGRGGRVLFFFFRLGFVRGLQKVAYLNLPRWITWCCLFRDLRGRYWPDFCEFFISEWEGPLVPVFLSLCMK